MSMRAAFVETVSQLLDEDPRVVLLLGDISVYAFRDAAKKHPKRVINCGVSEQAMVSMAAGLNRAGMYPVVHTIAPFLVERALEQLKVDFGYNRLAGCFVSVGASYDYSTAGCTHHCPGDVATLMQIPGMMIHAPGHPDEVRDRIRFAVKFGELAYVRLSEASNAKAIADSAAMERHGNASLALVISAGPTADLAQAITAQHAHLRLSTIVPFPRFVLDMLRGVSRVLVIEPFYRGTLTPLVVRAFPRSRLLIRSVGIPRDDMLRPYGTRAELDDICGLTPKNVAREMEVLLNA